MMIKQDQRGFTLVELMIAISVLSTVLLIVTIGITRIGQTYYKGIVQAQTQQTARSIIDEISQAIQFSGISSISGDADGNVASSSYTGGSYNMGVYCIGQHRFSFALNFQQNDAGSSFTNRHSKHGLWRDVIDNANLCNAKDLGKTVPGTTIPGEIVAADNDGRDGRELLGNKMRLTKFKIVQVPGTSDLYQIDVTVMYGDEDLINVAVPADPLSWESATCKAATSVIGASFCAKVDLSTIVGIRLR